MNYSQKGCRFYSGVSKANAEDPIGTVGNTDHWLIMEIPQPLSQNIFEKIQLSNH
jgi:hypothetical protein